ALLELLPSSQKCPGSRPSPPQFFVTVSSEFKITLDAMVHAGAAVADQRSSRGAGPLRQLAPIAAMLARPAVGHKRSVEDSGRSAPDAGVERGGYFFWHL